MINKLKTLIEKRMKRFWQYLIMCRFDFQVHFFDLWLNRFMSIGFAVLTFDNMNRDRSLFAVFYQPQDRRIWLSVCFINFRWYL